MSKLSRLPRGSGSSALPKESKGTTGSPDAWRTSSPLVDLTDGKLRRLVRTLTASCTGERERAVAIFNHVRRMPLVAERKWRLRTARQVLDRGQGDAVDKATLFLALLRIGGLPARMLFAPEHDGVRRGLPVDLSPMRRPLVEIWISGRWLRTDTFVFDTAYLTAAHHRLRSKREEYGYGVCAAGSAGWDGSRNAYVLGAEQEDELAPESGAVYRDAREFVRSLGFAQRLDLLARRIYWNAMAPRLQRILRALRTRQPRPSARPKKAGAPRRSQPAPAMAQMVFAPSSV
jgi:hypothetical protein